LYKLLNQSVPKPNKGVYGMTMMYSELYSRQGSIACVIAE